MEEALEECHKQLGENATVLFGGYNNRGQIKKWMKAAGADWDCYYAHNFFGWEAEQLVVMADGVHLMEQITRAKNKLYILFVDDDVDYSGFFQQAAEEGLVEMK